MGDVVYIVYAAISLILLAISCGPHLRAGNIGAMALVGWCFIINGMGFINAIVYFDTSENLTPVWCDIGASSFLFILLNKTWLTSSGCL